ncbi:hypothetical protein COO91_00745 [Nostoc flagelliforme CCNUN1]|uniref:Uncharacterized protein n=1 Tax=Nostoc flagelliforme CCNUN1 TaxID=2038116 RepID=A0A2K8SI07_9NOSO|nr:hypothetical protein COO91_00745 [Nostoc flagelliforme CCNUN1]
MYFFCSFVSFFPFDFLIGVSPPVAHGGNPQDRAGSLN